MEMPTEIVRSRNKTDDGFTLTDLLAVLAMGSLLLLLVWPACANTSVAGRTFGCVHHQRQLINAWLMYAHDHDGTLARNTGDFQTAWVSGWLDFSPSPANISTANLLDPKLASMGPYSRKAEIYRCPADESSIKLSGQPEPLVLPRVRSYSMNNALGVSGTGGSWLPSPPYKLFGNLSEINGPTPDQLFVFIDEHPDSINDGLFAVQMATPDRLETARIIDYPGSFHEGGAVLSYADGHADVHLWTDPRTKPLMRYGGAMPLNIASPNNLDVLWLSERTSGRRE